PAEKLDDREGAGEARAAVARVRLDELSLPFGIQQIHVARRRILGVDELRVVAHYGERSTPGREVAFGILELRRKAQNIRRRVWREPFLLLPIEEVRSVRR